MEVVQAAWQEEVPGISPLNILFFKLQRTGPGLRVGVSESLVMREWNCTWQPRSFIAWTWPRRQGPYRVMNVN
jgi:hypothetical protein